MGSRHLKKVIFLAALIPYAIACTRMTEEKFLGVVSTATPEASDIGEIILKKGGNAVDAAISISFALGVSEPAMSGLGGGTQVLLSLEGQPPIAINGTTFSPRQTPVDTRDTLTYHRRSTVPSTVKVLDHLFKNYGSGKVSWEELVEPSILLAENGFKVGPFRARVYKKYEEELLKSKHNTSYILADNMNVPLEGQLIKQPVLAKTLKRIAQYGANDFYTGKIAEDIALDMKKNGGWITLDDLKNFPAPKELPPLSISYNGHEVYSQPPPCGGWTTLLILNILRQEDFEKEIPVDALVRALYLAQNDRKKHPVTQLTNYEEHVNTKLSNAYAQKLLTMNLVDDEEETDEKSGETTHFSVVDAKGNAIAVTASINAYFGAMAASEKLGFLYNTYMDDFIFDNKTHPFAVRPSAMAYSSMSPTIVQKDKENVLVIGSPGSSRIISTVAQLSAKWMHQGELADLIKASRLHVYKNRVLCEDIADTLQIHPYTFEQYDLTTRIPNESLSNGFLNPYFGGVHAMAKENNIWVGVADPRRDGKVVYVEVGGENRLNTGDK